MRQPVLVTLALCIHAGGCSTVAVAQAVKVFGVKQIETGLDFCPDGQLTFQVDSLGVVQPELQIRVTLKPAPDAATAQEIDLRIELLDERRNVVSFLDSFQEQASSDPPWRKSQADLHADHVIVFPNRLPRPDRTGMPRYRLRVSLDTAKASKETEPFLLYWPALGEQKCKRIR